MRLLSLAAGVCPELEHDPVALIRAAAEAGWPACGIWFEADVWTDATTTAVRQALDNTGLIALDIEVVRMGTDRDQGERLIDAAARIGARNVLTVSAFDDPEEAAERFGHLCDLGAAADISVCLEFMRFSKATSLADALDIVVKADRPNAGILVDLLHLVRSGGSVADLAAVDPGLLPYAQWCDASAQPAGWSDPDLIVDAVDGRLLPGEGALPTGQFEAAFDPEVPFSVEVRSKTLRDAFADPTDRARATLAACHRHFG